MKTIFFNNPVGTEKVQFTVSNDSVEKLKATGIIPKDSKTVSYPMINEDSPREMKYLTAFPDRCTFDNMENPTEVVIDIELINSFWLSETKAARLECLEVLDKLQMRALLSNRQDIVSQIEEDKQMLRDLPEKINLADVKTAEQGLNLIPISDLQSEVYQYKYEAALK